MTIKALIITLSLFAFITSCKNKNKPIHKNTIETAHHWSYEGETSPEHWIEIEKNSDCDGNHQSPINIIHKDVELTDSKNELKLLYTPTTHISTVENNGHSVQFDFEPGDSISYKNDIYFLKQIHFHEPAEHKINGIIYPIEIHLVHISKSGNFAVLGVLGQEGTESQLFEFLESFLPIKTGETKSIHKKIDLSSLFLEKKSYYSYEGSLTTPPCTEGVQWIVFQQPIVLSIEEVLKLRENMPHNNYRNEQPLNNRIVKLNQ